MIVLGIGVGMAMNPVLMAAMGDVEQHEAGLASGVVNTSFMMGGALGLAVLASLAAWKTGGSTSAAALTAGYHLAFVVAVGFAALAAVIAVLFLRDKQFEPEAQHQPEAEPAFE
jgi:MFS family permease